MFVGGMGKRLLFSCGPFVRYDLVSASNLAIQFKESFHMLQK